MDFKTEFSDNNVILKTSKKPPAYYIWVRPAATLLPVDENGKFLVMHEYKESVKKWVWNFPGGIIEPGETASFAANRECEEELGIKATRTKKIVEVKTTFPDTSVTYFLGFDLKKTEGKGWEKIGKIKKVTIQELIKLALDGKINDPRLVVAILSLNRLWERGKVKLT